MATEGLASHVELVLRDAGLALEKLAVDWALVGGLAVSARSEPRFTRDVDLAVAVATDREAEALVRAFRNLGYRVDTLVEHEATDRLATVRFIPPGGEAHGVILDLLFASSGIEPEIVQAAQPLEVFPHLELPVAGVGELLAVKLLARDDERRPQDAVDIRALLQVATAAELSTARRALALITKRGFHRGRDLLTELARARPTS